MGLVGGAIAGKVDTDLCMMRARQALDEAGVMATATLEFVIN
jgi:hypothetical protein